MSDIEFILRNLRTWAVVGCSPDPFRDSHRIASMLKAKGYRVIPVNPEVVNRCPAIELPRLERA